MGMVQNLVDSFWMKTGKTHKVYPVQVEKHKVKGGDIVFTGMDRGRTLVKNGNKKFDLMNEPQAEGLVKYEDFAKTKDKDYVSIVMITRDKFVPLRRQYNLDYDTYEDIPKEKVFEGLEFDEEYFSRFDNPEQVAEQITEPIKNNVELVENRDVLHFELEDRDEPVEIESDAVNVKYKEEPKVDPEVNTLEYTLGVSSFLDWADQHIEQSWKITEVENEKWWENKNIQAVMIFIAAGLFWVFYGFGLGEIAFGDVTQAMEALQQAIQNSNVGVGN